MALRDDLITAPILLALSDESGRLAWPEVFANDHPVELEIGSGKGTFLVAMAEAFPERNFLGIEYAKPYAEYAADRLRRHGLMNTRMVLGEASWWIRCHVPDASVHALHVYFPDPWPKTRHHKRRLIQLPFLQEAHRILVPGGALNFVTDHADYFAWAGEKLSQQSDLQRVDFVAPRPSAAGTIVGTNFEKKYLAEGRTFQALAARKPAPRQ
jgi:tRNA (guanine-N7-)-methyltransferase